MSLFSERHNFAQPKCIRYRDELPPELRLPIIDLAARWVNSNALLKMVAAVLDPYGIEPKTQSRKLFDGSRQTLPPAGDAPLDATRKAITECSWPRVYDIVEFIYHFFKQQDGPEDEPPASRGLRHIRNGGELAPLFEIAINRYFVHAEIGWQLRNGSVSTRGNDVFESTISNSVSVLEQDQKPTAARHIQLAIGALSSRPKPDTSGAVAHATSAVECVLGEITTGKKRVLSDYLQENPGLFHPALKEGLGKIYAYASDVARHGKEGTEPAREDAEFAVATCAAVCTLLTRKQRK
jgi:AbiJ N-terminal domain 4